MTHDPDHDAQQSADQLARWEATDAQLRNLRLAFENAARERDDLTVRLLQLEQQLAGVPRPGVTVPLAELTEAERRVDELRDTLRRRRSTAKRLRARNARLEKQLRRARADADQARAALAARVSLPRRVLRRLRTRRAGRPRE